MTRRARWTTGDLNRLMKAAKENGVVVELEGDKVRLLPTEGAAPLPSDDSGKPAVERALAAWRRSA